MPYEAPFHLDHSSFNRTTLRIKTDSDELCISKKHNSENFLRIFFLGLLHEYEENNLYFDLFETQVALVLENFVVNVNFNMSHVPFLKDGIPCTQQL